MKVLILVWGASNRGKSQGIKQLAMSFPFKSIIQSWHDDDYDSYVIGTYNDEEGNERIVGIESQGDPGYSQLDWIEACVNGNCDVIVAACRTYGSTYNDAASVAHNNGYEIIEVTTPFHEGGDPVLANGLDLRESFASNIRNLILDCLK